MWGLWNDKCAENILNRNAQVHPQKVFKNCYSVLSMNFIFTKFVDVKIQLFKYVELWMDGGLQKAKACRVEPPLCGITKQNKRRTVTIFPSSTVISLLLAT